MRRCVWWSCPQGAVAFAKYLSCATGAFALLRVADQPTKADLQAGVDAARRETRHSFAGLSAALLPVLRAQAAPAHAPLSPDAARAAAAAKLPAEPAPRSPTRLTLTLTNSDRTFVVTRRCEAGDPAAAVASWAALVSNGCDRAFRLVWGSLCRALDTSADETLVSAGLRDGAVLTLEWV